MFRKVVFMVDLNARACFVRKHLQMNARYQGTFSLFAS